MQQEDLLHRPPPGFRVRDAILDDVPDLTRLWYASFNSSHAFWAVMTPDDPATRQWWNEAWTMGIQAGPAVLRTFVVEDLAQDGLIVAFARWNVPQEGGKQDIPLPEFPREWDLELTEALWGGMPRNRAAVMGQRPHWMLEFLGVDPAYQQKGLGFTLVDWGCRQADATGLEVYLDATIKGLPFYKKHFGFQERKALVMPARVDSFGTYELMAGVRPKTLTMRADVEEKHVPTSRVVELVAVQGA
ncbi:Uu.00g076160.m01.CDS01 [Anthostomella pinea]|uniref:Uu.00g076160.m01.CDS01 n=1 Tax=Anthostomella pinea TaxID=933095 RepID=A0AAI8YPB6_9PEZI|nr:Uu.00g076160.m01.CDS01 [Anthostomella pinea]